MPDLCDTDGLRFFNKQLHHTSENSWKRKVLQHDLQPSVFGRILTWYYTGNKCICKILSKTNTISHKVSNENIWLPETYTKLCYIIWSEIKNWWHVDISLWLQNSWWSNQPLIPLRMEVDCVRVYVLLEDTERDKHGIFDFRSWIHQHWRMVFRRKMDPSVSHRTGFKIKFCLTLILWQHCCKHLDRKRCQHLTD